MTEADARERVSQAITRIAGKLMPQESHYVEWDMALNAREWEAMAALMQEISRVAMSAAKDAEEAAREARAGAPALEPD
jgi:hypothetical protein